jgi:molybdenum cofactor cytidylyltransferase
VPTHRGKRGNPVLWASRYFAEICALRGDVGARHLIGEHAEQVCEVPMSDDAVLLDVDSPAALSELLAQGEV